MQASASHSITVETAANVLEDIADYYEFKSENPFKVRAMENAARILRGKSGTINDLMASGELAETKGIGQGILEKLQDLLDHGKSTYLESLKRGTPEGLHEMLRVPGLGAKRLKVLYEKLKIDSLEKLQRGCEDGSIAKLKGFGEKSAQKILEGIAFIRSHGDRLLFSEIYPHAKRLEDFLRSLKAVHDVSLGGSLRRRLETAKDIDIVVGTDKPKAVIDAFVAMKEVQTITGQGDTKGSIVTHDGIRADLRAVSVQEFPYALHHFTGSREHNTAMRTRAKAMGLKMNEYGLFKGEKLIVCKSEAEIFKKLGLHYIPPELRENMGEIDAAEKDDFHDLITEDDLQGVLHVHSTYSDGKATLEEMVQGAIERKLKYIGFSDHSQSAAYAGGLKPDRLKKQADDIAKLREKYPKIRIFHGIESDILKNGDLDYTDKVLESLDFVVASVHSGFNLSEKEMTERVVRALKHPSCTILGHPTGRLLLARDAFAIRMEEILETAAELGKVVEINADPHRFDLDWRLGGLARKLGLVTSINPDAHSVRGMDHMSLGVGIARKAGFRKKDVLNARSASEISTIFEKGRVV